MNNVRVVYNSDIACLPNINRYKYYDLIVEGDKYSIIDEFGNKQEHTKEMIQEYFTLEVGTWEDYFKPSKKLNNKTEEEVF